MRQYGGGNKQEKQAQAPQEVKSTLSTFNLTDKSSQR